MKTCYLIYEVRAIADLSPYPFPPFNTDADVRRISRINVPAANRGLGYGTRLLKQICVDADLEGIDLLLEPVPSGGLDFDELVAWYKRYGFEMREECMYRKARTK